MSVIERAAPIRRSPLAEWHRQRGGRPVSTGEWPATYGDVHRERRAVRERVGLLDAGPFDRLALAGGRLAADPPAPPFVVARVTDGRVDGRVAQLWGLTSESSLLVLPGTDARSAGALAARLDAEGIRTIDVSSYYATLVLAGPRARDVLEELFTVDVSERALPDRTIVFGPLARVTATFARLDLRSSPAFSVMVERDQAEYVWEALLRIGERHGIEPVGALAVAED